MSEEQIVICLTFLFTSYFWFKLGLGEELGLDKESRLDKGPGKKSTKLAALFSCRGGTLFKLLQPSSSIRRSHTIFFGAFGLTKKAKISKRLSYWVKFWVLYNQQRACSSVMCTNEAYISAHF